MNSAQQTFAFLDEPGSAVRGVGAGAGQSGSVPGDPRGFVPRDIYPACKKHKDRDAHWRLIDPNLHRGTPGTFLCDECKDAAVKEAEAERAIGN
jgi:hypothetical protein